MAGTFTSAAFTRTARDCSQIIERHALWTIVRRLKLQLMRPSMTVARKAMTQCVLCILSINNIKRAAGDDENEERSLRSKSGLTHAQRQSGEEMALVGKLFRTPLVPFAEEKEGE